MASGSSRLSGSSPGTGRAVPADAAVDHEMGDMDALGLSSRAIDCASPRSANFPMAKVADSAKPFTPAVAPDSKMAP